MQFLGLVGNVGAGISRNSAGVQYSCSVLTSICMPIPCSCCILLFDC